MDWHTFIQSLPNILLLLLALFILWLVLRFVLRLAWRLFTCGCAMLVLLALVLLALHFAQRGG